MVTGTFRLKGRELIEKYGNGKTIYRISEDSDINYTTIRRWVNDPDSVKGVQGDILFNFLMGLGFSLEQIKDLPLGEVFEFEPEENKATE